ncbi:MAG TPA: hypothetical protein VK957_18810, partial [Lunatimonas sp.]|nr:hypothetical protein [Lunatimonas sp.]
MMAAKKNTIHGKVLEPISGNGLSNHSIEAWLENTSSTQAIGTAVSNAEGEFHIEIDPKILRKPTKGDTPKVYFKIFTGKRLYKNTKDSLTWNIDQKEKVNIEMEGPKVIAGRGDKLITSQILKAASFINESDFTGVYEDFRKRASSSLGVISDMVMNSLTELDFEPVRVRGPKMEEIVNKNVKQVKKNLSNHNITVDEVKPYSQINANSIRDIGDFTTAIKPG